MQDVPQGQEGELLPLPYVWLLQSHLRKRQAQMYRECCRKLVPYLSIGAKVFNQTLLCAAMWAPDPCLMRGIVHEHKLPGVRDGHAEAEREQEQADRADDRADQGQHAEVAGGQEGEHTVQLMPAQEHGCAIPFFRHEVREVRHLQHQDDMSMRLLPI